MQTSGKEIVRNLYLAKSLAISSLVVESCFDSCRRGDFLVDDSEVKGAPFLFRYFFGSFDEFLSYPIMFRRSRVISQFLMSVNFIIFVLFLYPAILK